MARLRARSVSMGTSRVRRAQAEAPATHSFGKVEEFRPAGFGSFHLAVIGLVVVAFEVEEAVEEEDLELVFGGVALLFGLFAGAGEGDGYVA